ncbi:DUF1236 domain-containing protein [Rhizobium sp. BK379]|uniref:DUF1236 domain-containing protein n=1 Tax=Rhizobium sp. BK379 TaxID=2587059 RepID=UPI00161A6D34|nr:DUF1236 domain-containing protein [Rhizobium sp. BK379]MBB3446764.1 hypothetical protein [Rhizobium sp. BK379]
MNIKAVGIAAALLMVSGTAFAQSSTVTGAAGGAATGAIVGDPVGAAVGGIVGGVAGSVIDPPPQKVVTYVQQAPAPETHVVVTPIPDEPKYSYAIVNDERVIVEPSSRKVIQVIQ